MKKIFFKSKNGLNHDYLITIKDGEQSFQARKEDRKTALQETLKFFLKYL